MMPRAVTKRRGGEFCFNLGQLLFFSKSLQRFDLNSRLHSLSPSLHITGQWLSDKRTSVMIACKAKVSGSMKRINFSALSLKRPHNNLKNSDLYLISTVYAVHSNDEWCGRRRRTRLSKMLASRLAGAILWCEWKSRADDRCSLGCLVAAPKIMMLMMPNHGKQIAFFAGRTNLRGRGFSSVE